MNTNTGKGVVYKAPALSSFKIRKSGIECVEARDSAKWPTLHKKAPHNKELAETLDGLTL